MICTSYNIRSVSQFSMSFLVFNATGVGGNQQIKQIFENSDTASRSIGYELKSIPITTLIGPTASRYITRFLFLALRMTQISVFGITYE